MNNYQSNLQSSVLRIEASSLVDRVARAVVIKALSRITEGELIHVENGESQTFGKRQSDFDLSASVQIHAPAFYRRIALGGSVGAGEAYVEGLWSSNDLTALVRILARNRAAMETMEKGSARLTAPLKWLHGFLRANTRSGSRRNIAAHYDLGNDFFALFLDETMSYSSGIFERPNASMREASFAKMDAACRKLNLRPEDHLIEIGTGWGALAIHAAERYGCRVTTTTISREQAALANERITENKLQDRVTVLLTDYRDLNGQFDKLVSIEMIEAVGHEYFDTYFRKCSELLKPNGMALIQGITIQDQRYESARREVDFIKRYIFPGGCLPSVSTICASLTRATDMRLFHFEDFGPHYARTLQLWRERFCENLDRVRSLGFSESFIRMWIFYLCYCEGGFLERTIGVSQILMTKPLCRREPLITSKGVGKCLSV